MKELFGSPGKKSGLILRIGQCLFAAASIGIMASASGFSTTTAFCYLIASMGLQVLWSFGLASLDMHALRFNKDLHNHITVGLFVVGDWIAEASSVGYVGVDFDTRNTTTWEDHVTATLSLAAACSSAGVMVLFTRDTTICQIEPKFSCDMFQISIAFAFASWFLLAISSYVMFWLFATI